MAVNADDIRPEELEEGVREPNSYYKAFDAIVAGLDELAKLLTPDEYDDGTPADEGVKPCCNSSFSSFRNIADALERVKYAAAERIAGEIPVERIPKEASSFDFASPTAVRGRTSLANHAVNSVVMDGTAIAFAFPAKTDGKARDFIVRLTMNAATSWSLPGGASFESDDEDVFAEVEPGATAVFFFFEIADDVFMVSRKAANAVAKEV